VPIGTGGPPDCSTRRSGHAGPGEARADHHV